MTIEQWAREARDMLRRLTATTYNDMTKRKELILSYPEGESHYDENSFIIDGRDYKKTTASKKVIGKVHPEGESVESDTVRDDVFEEGRLEYKEWFRRMIENAHMAGQHDAGVDPGYSNARAYCDEVLKVCVKSDTVREKLELYDEAVRIVPELLSGLDECYSESEEGKHLCNWVKDFLARAAELDKEGK